ncbi:MAG: hypothetical protein ACPGJV_13505 [Bacteriovoracaceae bacterium]
MELIKKKAINFDRKIQSRNFRESLAGLFVAIWFSKMATEQDSLFETLACIEVAFAGIFISFYAYYHSSKKNLKEITKSSFDYLNDHKEALSQQIELLSTVRYWYVAPLLGGILTLEGYRLYEALLINGNTTSHLISMAITLCLGIFVVYLNEYYTVKKLKEELLSLDQDRYY